MGYNFQENTSTYVFNVTHVLIVNVNKEVKPAFGARLYCPECFFQFAGRRRIRRALGARTQVEAGAGSGLPEGAKGAKRFLA